MLSETVDVVIGCDTHRDSHSVAVVDATSQQILGQFEIPATGAGYREALQNVTGVLIGRRRAWAIEGTGSYGKGLTRYLTNRGEMVIEISRPLRPAKRSQPKTDALDAIVAARTAIAQTGHNTPRAGQTREAIRVLLIARESATMTRARSLKQIKALVVTAPDQLRDRLRSLPAVSLLNACARLRDTSPDHATNATRTALRTLARAAIAATRDKHTLDTKITQLLETGWPGLLTQTGVGPVSAAQLVLSYSHHGRCHTEAAFARLAAVAPIPASTGKTIRHRLDPGGDRQLNRALHTIAMHRARHDPETIAYLDRKTQEGKTKREARRCLKRHLARRLYKHLKNIPTPP